MRSKALRAFAAVLLAVSGMGIARAETIEDF